MSPLQKLSNSADDELKVKYNQNNDCQLLMAKLESLTLFHERFSSLLEDLQLESSKLHYDLNAQEDRIRDINDFVEEIDEKVIYCLM